MIGKFFERSQGVGVHHDGSVSRFKERAPDRSCDVFFLLDNSGSMAEYAHEVVDQFNHFLKEQKGHAQADARMTLALFNDDLRVVTESQSLMQFQHLHLAKFNPDGNTALVDALGLTIMDGMARHAKIGRPLRTLVVLLTDGEENASQKHTIPEVKGMVERARLHFGWEFVLIGVGVNTRDVAQELGILPHLALSVANGKAAMRRAFKAASGAAQAALTGQEIRLLTGGGK